MFYVVFSIMIKYKLMFTYVGTCFDALGTTNMMTTASDQNLLQQMNDPSMFYNDQFPQIPEFPCMSSSSSSSSNPAPAKPISSATTISTASSMSSSAASWAELHSEYGDGGQRDVKPFEGIRVNRNSNIINNSNNNNNNNNNNNININNDNRSERVDCMDVMENYGYMDLIDGNEMWDPSSIFEQNPPDMQPESEVVQDGEMKDGGGGGGEGRLDELGTMFFEWLKSNKELVSAEDMRNIKIKKSTVECASKRLGSSTEGKKQLLKLILEWVQHHQLQRKNSACGEAAANAAATLYPFQPPPPPPPPFNCNTWTPPQWISPYPPYMADGNAVGMVAPQVQPPPTFSYMGGGYDSGLNCHSNPYNNTGSGDYGGLESAPSWNPSQITMAVPQSPYTNQFPDVGNSYAPQIMPLAPGYPEPFSYNLAANYGGADDQRLTVASSATKEARKKRMARQRRTYFHHHHHSRNNKNNQPNHVASSDHQPQAMVVADNCSGQSQVGNWLYWPQPPSAATFPPPPPMEVPNQSSSVPQQSGDRQSKQTSSDKLQGLKTEKNLKFLLQKVLKQSDVGSLGRIVMPKKEAETHLPDLDSRDGITLPMEDIGTSQVWNMRYRFWPNNKSRMYLLENTGDFVKANGLQEGDFIVLYSNVKCGKYLIRGVKVRQPASGKSEGKKPVKRSYQSTS
ncbi:B3 domain-containing transcription factor ABI3-like isoform X2 [Bidens hawaiensis]|uniref:B3 domain-containing transcription factor ABI3-like isoform X2 n=1 Tax=Bidens hawaiensis TaxID=980011 RepID=UPI0040493B47